MQNVNDIRTNLLTLYLKKDFKIDKTGSKIVEIIGESFEINEHYLIRLPNENYINREIEWYKSQSLKVSDIPGDAPAIWKNIADKDGNINSNYGYLIFHNDNHRQYFNCLSELVKNPDSRRATMIYNRPSMHEDYNKNGMNDFICTYANQFFINNNELISQYIMRSNDAVFGFNNDVAWATHIHKKLYQDLLYKYPNLKMGKLIWTPSSLHVYEKHFYCFEYFLITNTWPATKNEYDRLREKHE